MIEVKPVEAKEDSIYDDVINALRKMDSSCIRTNGREFLEGAKAIEDAVIYLTSFNDMLLERLQNIEAERWTSNRI